MEKKCNNCNRKITADTSARVHSTYTNKDYCSGKCFKEKEAVEILSAEIHKLYCAEYEKQNSKKYWTKGDYSKLGEPTKEFDRNLAKWHLKKIKPFQKTIAELKQFTKSADELIGKKIKEMIKQLEEIFNESEKKQS